MRCLLHVCGSFVFPRRCDSREWRLVTHENVTYVLDTRFFSLRIVPADGWLPRLAAKVGVKTEGSRVAASDAVISRSTVERFKHVL